MFDLIVNSYDTSEAERHRTYELTDEDIELIKDWAKWTLVNFPSMRNCCAAMSATWGALIRDKTRIPAHVVSGILSYRGKRLFGDDASAESLAERLMTSSMSWDGHFWVDFAGTIGEISLFRTAYAESSPQWLRSLITQQFGPGRGMLIATPEGMLEDGLIYEARYVLTDDQISALIKGASQIIKNGGFNTQFNC